MDSSRSGSFRRVEMGILKLLGIYVMAFALRTWFEVVVLFRFASFCCNSVRHLYLGNTVQYPKSLLSS